MVSGLFSAVEDGLDSDNMVVSEGPVVVTVGDVVSDCPLDIFDVISKVCLVLTGVGGGVDCECGGVVAKRPSVVVDCS